MSKKDEINVSKLIEDNLNIKFQNRRYILDNWGQVDNWCEIANNIFLFLEVETSQKHPNTNVLKVWPYLLEHRNIRVFLIQTYFTYSPGFKSNRGRLSEWLGNEIKRQSNGRFNYNRIIVDEDIDWNSIRNQLLNFENNDIQ